MALEPKDECCGRLYHTTLTKNDVGGIASLPDDPRSASPSRALEMESATLFTLARVFGLKAGAIFAVTANGATNGFEVKAGIEDSIDVAIEGVGRLRRFGV